jgi:hypothetical protein
MESKADAMELDINAQAADIFVLEGDPIVTATHVSPFLRNLCDGFYKFNVFDSHTLRVL